MTQNLVTYSSISTVLLPYFKSSHVPYSNSRFKITSMSWSWTDNPNLAAEWAARRDNPNPDEAT
jgi:hypothetical protein